MPLPNSSLDLLFTISDDATARNNLSNMLTSNVEKDHNSSSTKGLISHSFTQLTEALLLAQQEEDSVFNDIALVDEYVHNLENYGNNLQRILVSEDSSKFLQNVYSTYLADANIQTNEQKLNLLNMFLTQEQGNMYFYMLSEYHDRLAAQQQNAFLKVPIFKQFPKNYIDLLPMDDMSLASHHFLSSFFNSEEFLPSKGNNKRIISVGIPPGLFRHIRHNRSSNLSQQGLKIKDNIVRVKVYRVDKLHPEIVFRPKEFMFEMIRFPTRIVGNWNPDVLFDSNSFDPMLAPTKIVDWKGSVILHKNFEDASLHYLNANVLSTPEFTEIYRNHVRSFLLEEYIRWFADVKIDERIFHNYAGVKNAMDVTESQYQRYYQIIKGSPVVAGAVGIARFNTADGIVLKSVINDSSNKGVTVDMTDTIREYLMNETFFLDSGEYRRRAVYPKKFDRVFNIIFSPDDFLVDKTNSTKESLDHLRDRGILVEMNDEYSVRDSTENDTSFDDYFVTVEPYDYTQEVETKTYEAT